MVDQIVWTVGVFMFGFTLGMHVAYEKMRRKSEKR